MEIFVALIELAILIWVLSVLSSILYYLRRIDAYCEWRAGTLSKPADVAKRSEPRP